MKKYSIDEMRKDKGKIYDEVWRLMEQFADKYPDILLDVNARIYNAKVPADLVTNSGNGLIMTMPGMIEVKVEIKIP